MTNKPLIYAAALSFMLLPSGAVTAQDSSSTATDSVRTVTAGDSSAAAVPDSTPGGLVLPVAVDAGRADSLVPGASPADSAAPAADPAVRTARPTRPVRGDAIEVRVIPWDWDQYTNVVAVGLRSLRDGVEYSLTRNLWYDSLFIRYQGMVVQVRGRSTRDEDGFYNMTVNAILPPDTSAAVSGGASQP